MPMGYPVQTATTAQPIVFGPMVSSTDHLAAVTGITPTVTISKAGGSFASPAGAISEVGNGFYKIAGNATDNATVGPLVVHATGTGADSFDDVFTVVAYNPLSATNLGLSALPTANPAASGGLPTTDASNGVKVSVGTGTGQINAASGNVPADLQTIKTQALTCAAPVTVLASVGTASASTAQTGDNFARLGAPAGASHAADIAAVKTDTTKLGTPAGASVSADIAAVKVDSAAIKVVTDALAAGNTPAVVLASPSPTTTVFGLNVNSSENLVANAFASAWAVFTTSTGDKYVRRAVVSHTSGTTPVFTVTPALPSAPATGDAVVLIGAGST
jgi:hypothetical protein